jgi:hypothetical protein
MAEEETLLQVEWCVCVCRASLQLYRSVWFHLMAVMESNVCHAELQQENRKRNKTILNVETSSMWV